MTQVVFDIPTFRALFPEFAANPPYTDPALTVKWDEAALYVSPDNCGDLRDAKRAYAVMLMTAHLMRLGKMVAATAVEGGLVGVVTQATVDKVSVTLAPPPTQGAFGYWLAQTPYGQQLATYLSMQAAGGMYVGGNPERAAFRKVGGVF